MIKSNLFSIYFMLFFIGGTCISCDHTWGKHPTTTYCFSQELKDYTIFNIGSYWVYEDSASKAIDSIYLFDQKYSLIEEGRHNSEKSQYLEECKHSSIGPSTLSFTAYLPFDKKTGVYAENVRPILNPTINYYDGKVGTSLSYINDPYYEEKRDSIFFQGKFYHVKIFLSFQQMYPNHSKRLYYAKHIGLVRKELFNGEVWNLIRYHVSQ